MHPQFLELTVEQMWLTFFVLFIALCPGVVFTAPSLGKKLGGKLSIVFIHALVFVIIVSLLPDSVEEFQSPRTVPQAKSILAAAQSRLNSSTRNVENIRRDIAKQVALIENRSAVLAANKSSLADAQAKAQETNAMVSTTAAAYAEANAQMISARNAYNAAIANVTLYTGKIANDATISQMDSLKISSMQGVLNRVQTQVTMDQRLVAQAEANLMTLAAASTMQKASTMQSSGLAPTGKCGVNQYIDVIKDACGSCGVAGLSVVAGRPDKATMSNVIASCPSNSPAAQFAVEAQKQMAGWGAQAPSTIQMAVYGEPNPGPASAGSSVLSAVLGAVGLAGSTPRPIGPIYINGSNYPVLTVNSCAPGQYALFYNGRNDGTGSSNYMPMCTPCATAYRPNPLIPVEYDTLTTQNYASFCVGTPGFRP